MTLTRRERLKLWFLCRVKQPVDLARVLGMLAACLLLFMVALSFVGERQDRRSLEASFSARAQVLQSQLAEQQALNDCRSGLAAEVSAATSNQLIVIGRLVVALGNRDPDGFTTQLDDLLKASERLAAASDARDEFERTQECPP
jgi:hypothetical protein